jgi:hypothetical protein
MLPQKRTQPHKCPDVSFSVSCLSPPPKNKMFMTVILFSWWSSSITVSYMVIWYCASPTPSPPVPPPSDTVVKAPRWKPGRFRTGCLIKLESDGKSLSAACLVKTGPLCSLGLNAGAERWGWTLGLNAGAERWGWTLGLNAGAERWVNGAVRDDRGRKQDKVGIHKL